MSQKSVSIIGAVLGAFAVGSVIGWTWSSAGDALLHASRSPLPSRTGAAHADQRESASRAGEREFRERFEKALAIRSSVKRTRAIAAIGDELTPEQLRSAIEAVQRTRTAESQSVLLALLSRWTELEPEAAFGYAQGYKGDNNLVAIGEVAKSWARTNPEAVREAIAKVPEGMLRSAGIAGLIEALSETNPEEAFRLAEKTQTFSNPIDTLFKNWAEKDPQSAGAHALRLPPGFQRDAAIHATARTWAKADVSGALSWTASLPDADAIGRLGSGTSVGNIILTWADEDADSALRWLEELPEGSRKSGILNTLCTQYAYRPEDPLLAARLISMAQSGKARDDTWGTFINAWADSDLAGATAWVDQQPDDVRQAVLPALARNIAQTDPARAIKLASALPEKAKDNAVKDVLSTWAHADPSGAGEWARKQPPKTAFLESVAAAWINRDVTGATEWINTIEGGAVEDEVLSRVVRRVQERNPEIAVAWIEGISDEGKRETAYKNLGRGWLRIDRAAARAWIESSPLPQAFKDEMLSRPEK
jgi:hypothetical protein